ncbi:MAG: DNA-protecting protein DprA [Clostridiales bacterium]|nr:DNA-protecting protein DprA [Clostridiales bacterium]
MEDTIYWIWLAMKCGAGSAEGIKLLSHFGSAKAIYEATYDELLVSNKCDNSFIKKLNDRDLDKASNVMNYCFNNNIHIITCASEDYPHRLYPLYNRPLVLYTRGKIEHLNEKFCVGVIGTRTMTNYGKQATFDLVRNLCGYHAVIVSGAAYGADAVANHTALYFEGETIAVLGSGVDVPYPYDNKELINRIAENGMVISEYLPTATPTKSTFPIRNRIISGLSDALVVTEAGERSGALITARHAREQGRNVYAIPGNIDVPGSKGVNQLIRDGASICTCAEDIVDDFALKRGLKRDERVFNSDQFLHFNEIARSRNLSQSFERAEANHKNIKINSITTNGIPHFGYKKNDSNLTDYRSGESIKNPDNPPNNASVARTENKNDDEKNAKQVTKKPTTNVKIAEAETSNDDTLSEIVNSREFIYSKLSEVQKRVFDAIPDDEAIAPDKIVQTGISTGDVLSSLTMLELHSAIEMLPGGIYKKIV